MSLPLPVITKRQPIGTIGLPLVSAKIEEEPSSYELLECQESLLTADQIVTRWRSDRHALAKAITPRHLSDPWRSVISKDDACMCRMGTEQKAFINTGVCTGCTALSRLFKQGEISVSTPFSIQIGAYTGLKLVAQHYHRGVSIAHGLAGYEETKKPHIMGGKLIEDFSTMQACEPSFAGHVQDTSFWACRGSTLDHYMVISCFLENEMIKGGLSTLPIFKWVYECRGDINTVEEVPSLGKGTLAEITAVSEYLESPRSPTARSTPILPLSNDVTRGLLLQLVSTLHFASKYAFTHGLPCLAYLGFSKTPAAYIYDSVKVASPITLRFIPSGASSISAAVQDPRGASKIIRIYHPGTLFEQSLDVKSLPKIEVMPFFGVKRVPENCSLSSGPGALAVTANPCLSKYLSMRVIGYKINGGKETSLTPELTPFSFASYVRHLGIPLFHSSFDLYAFWTALMCEEPFYLAVHNDQELIDIWKQLFNVNEYDSLMTELLKLRRRGHVTVTSDEIMTLLSKYSLRCDALEHTWAALKRIVV